MYGTIETIRQYPDGTLTKISEQRSELCYPESVKVGDIVDVVPKDDGGQSYTIILTITSE